MIGVLKRLFINMFYLIKNYLMNLINSVILNIFTLIKNLIKKAIMLLIIFKLLGLMGCAAIMNHNKPDLRDNAAIGSALHYGVIERKATLYEIGNCLLIVPLILGLGGYDYDQVHNNYYVVTDRNKYEAWKKKYLKELSQEREQFLKDN